VVEGKGVRTWAFQHDRHNAKVQNGPQQNKKNKKIKKKINNKNIQKYCTTGLIFLNQNHQTIFIRIFLLQKKQQTEHFNSQQSSP
jgi:hypothetical protein